MEKLTKYSETPVVKEQDPEVTIRQSEVDAYIDEINMLRELVAELTSVETIVKEEQQFKPISEMTLEDWQQAMEEGALFEYYNGSTLTLSEVNTICFEPRVGFEEHPFLFSKDGSNLESGYRIKYRIK